jgi:hypothetical protein
LRQAAIDRAFDIDELGVDTDQGAGLDGCDHAATRSMSRANARAVTNPLVPMAAWPVGRWADTCPNLGRTSDSGQRRFCTFLGLPG